ncbi:hypothetical protein [Branchiibius sp. NY16-3462-2]|uniref:hypothetical protein n=1 Tax=Branchiibius sp. NY16-3462-2 TaxID=1807500 RepID=UPI00079B21CF|nr:hypothetical protein [Branchiibius sp. NY16-3462-2]KYH43525.1 ATP-grasp enzyme [Branchiibius sp. NY16-3462-2]
MSAGSVRARARTAGALLLLQAMAPANLVMTAIALTKGRSIQPPRIDPSGPRRTVLLSGGKMTKALQLARSFHAAGHRVVLVEQEKYRWSGHRFSRAVDAFYPVPTPQDPGYAQALLRVVRAEGVDVYVPVCSPAASVPDAQAEAVLSPYCEVLHGDPDTIEILDDKEQFIALAAKLGLNVPDSVRITEPAQVASFDFRAGRSPYVLKSISYDPVHRLDLTPLPRESPAATAEFAASKPIAPDNPWVLQQYVEGREFCTHGTVREGRLQVFACCPSSPFQVNYRHVDKPAIEEWVRGFVGPLRLTGQYSFDFIEDEHGEVYPIECNPRTHSAITMFYQQPELAAAYLQDRDDTLRPSPTARPTYWLYHELWRMITGEGGRRARWRVIRDGKDAILDPADPWPFFIEHHVQIPLLLWRNLLSGKDFIRIDFNIGKLVEAAGD